MAAGTRFGPFLGKWVLEPQREEFAWEVSAISPQKGWQFWGNFSIEAKTFATQCCWQNQCSTATAVVPLAAVSRHLATFCGKFWAAAIFWTFSTIFGIFSEVLPMGTSL